MIDAEARSRLAESIRALAAGLISNDDFEDRVPRHSLDPAVREVFRSGAWYLYSDLHDYRLVGPYRLPPSARVEVARWVLFLKSDRPYEWPIDTPLLGLLHFLLATATLGLATRIRRRAVRRVGDLAVWPFLKAEHLEAARAAHPYLRGAA